MLVPKFTITQNHGEIVIIIKLPYIRVGDSEVQVDGRDFSFYCKPYLLKLTFPEELKGSEDEEEHCRAVYDADKDHGTMTLHLKKKEPGVEFKDLDLTTNLLQSIRAFDVAASGRTGSDKMEGMAPPSIEVLHSKDYISSTSSSSAAPEEGEDGKEEKQESTARQEGAAGNDTEEGSSITPPIIIVRPMYGFNRQYSGVFEHLKEEMADVLRMPDPEGTPDAIRRQLREEAEGRDFDGDRYLGDYCQAHEDPVYEEAMQMKAFWEIEEEGGEQMTDEEREEMATLKNREFLIDDEQAVLLGLVDLLLAFAYDYRTTSGEPTVESCWTVTTLSPSLSWLETHGKSDIKAVIQAFLRRSLTYPYLREWKLSQRVLEDVAKILRKGRRTILRCLLRARKVLRRTESHYLLNRIFLDDYCVYIQQLSDAAVSSLAARFSEAACHPGIGKIEVGLGLLELEALVSEEEEEETEEESSPSEEEEDSSECESSEEEKEEEEKEEVLSSERANLSIKKEEEKKKEKREVLEPTSSSIASSVSLLSKLTVAEDRPNGEEKTRTVKDKPITKDEKPTMATKPKLLIEEL